MTFFQIGTHKYVNGSQIAFVDYIPNSNSYEITDTKGRLIKADMFEVTTAHSIADEKEK